MKTEASGGAAPPPLNNVASTVLARLDANPAAPAVITGEQVITFAALSRGVAALSAALHVSGVRAGQTVGISMVQTPLHLMTMIALAALGAVSVPVHPLVPQERRRLAATRYGVSHIVSGLGRMRLEGIPFIDVGKVDLGQGPAEPEILDVSADAPFRIAISSGTSGDPKGVMYSHGYMLQRMERTNYGCVPGSRILTMDLNFPISFAFALGMLSVGGAVVFAAEMTPPALMKAIRSHAVTHWLLSPAMAQQIAGLLADEDIHFPTLTHLRIVGATPAPRLLQTLKTRFSPNVFVPYGSTEMGVVSIATPQLLETYPGSSGRLCPWSQAEVVDENKIPLPNGESGNLRLKIDGMVDAYYLDPVRSAERFLGGWYYPGDRARIEDGDILYIEGREDEVLNVDGSKVNPEDIEAVLLAHPSVHEAAALAVELAGGRVMLVAAYVATGALDEDALRAHAAQRLGATTPRRFIAVPAFPRNTNGKLLRDRLAREVGAILAASPDATEKDA